jgi:hypothetical protein
MAWGELSNSELANSRPFLANLDLGFDLIHVGKCAGSSLAAELSQRDYSFNHIHMTQPTMEPNRKVVVLVRDPVERFISAFNWRLYLLRNDLIPMVADDPIKNLKRRLELKVLLSFEDVNDFAEQLPAPQSQDFCHIHALMGLIGHAHEGFSWYLSDLVDQIKPDQLLGVIAQERLKQDTKALFGFTPKLTHKSNYPSHCQTLSARGRTNLAWALRADYKTLKALSGLADRAGKPMSVAYTPSVGALALV